MPPTTRLVLLFVPVLLLGAAVPRGAAQYGAQRPNINGLTEFGGYGQNQVLPGQQPGQQRGIGGLEQQLAAMQAFGPSMGGGMGVGMPNGMGMNGVPGMQNPYGSPLFSGQDPRMSRGFGPLTGMRPYGVPYPIQPMGGAYGNMMNPYHQQQQQMMMGMGGAGQHMRMSGMMDGLSGSIFDQPEMGYAKHKKA